MLITIRFHPLEVLASVGVISATVDIIRHRLPLDVNPSLSAAAATVTDSSESKRATAMSRNHRR